MIQAILTDIEGTTTSIRFVYDVLFPYARAHLADFVRRNADHQAVARLLDEVRSHCNSELSLDACIEQLDQWMKQDQKVTPLKSLQGLVWDAGYRSGDFKGHVYDDVYYNLTRWVKLGLKNYVYSSGSIKAQKLLFGYSEFGDMTHLFSGYFDTTTGAKQEIRSYQQIADQISLPADNIVFLSDVDQELYAAEQVGMHTAWLVREGDLTPNPDYPQFRNFDEVSQKFALGWRLPSDESR